MLLRPYQLEVARAVLSSIQENKGMTLSVEISRQGGKNELSAHLEILLLTLYMARGGSAIKCSPTFKPQTLISMTRLKDRLEDFGFSGAWQGEQGYMVKLGLAKWIFLSAEEHSQVVGHTADILLEIDESQDVSRDKYSKEFRPMASANNTTTVHYGTTWDDSTLLEQIKQANLELEKKDGIKRHFSYPWQEVAKHNPAYGKFVESERERLGEDHPLFRTQYRLELLAGGNRFLLPAHLAQCAGVHPRRRLREQGKIYIAGIDFAGENEILEDEILVRPGRDSTVITIAELIPGSGQKEPALNVVEHYAWTGRKHSELYPQIVDILKNVWNCQRLICDSTGIGEPITSFLQKSLGNGRVISYKFSQKSKSDLGFELLAFVNSGRLKLYKADNSGEYRECIKQLESARSIYRPNQTLNFFVEPEQGHDDYLMSLALCVHGAKDYAPRRAVGVVRE
jgi:hypothetical protein